MTLLDSLKADLLRALELLGIIQNQRMEKRDKIYDTAVSFIGRDATPKSNVPNEVACAEVMSTILQKALPELRFPMLVSTRDMYNYLVKSPSFEEVSYQDYGDIIISPTGLVALKNGHVGTLGKNDAPNGSRWIISNNSLSGTVEVNFTLDGWHRYYGRNNGTIAYFRVS